LGVSRYWWGYGRRNGMKVVQLLALGGEYLYLLVMRKFQLVAIRI
jgi:hypothetical protein